jgi:hypothetical protein
MAFVKALFDWFRPWRLSPECRVAELETSTSYPHDPNSKFWRSRPDVEHAGTL